jgi:biotin synthase
MTTLASITVEALRQTIGHAAVPAAEPGRWAVADIVALYALPFMDLLFRAQQVHRAQFDANEVQLSTLLSIKTGGCSEDCGYCPQSSHFDTGVEATKLMPLTEVVEAAQAAKAQGATRFCMGAAWRSPKERDMERVPV